MKKITLLILVLSGLLSKSGFAEAANTQPTSATDAAIMLKEMERAEREERIQDRSHPRDLQRLKRGFGSREMTQEEWRRYYAHERNREILERQRQASILEQLHRQGRYLQDRRERRIYQQRLQGERYHQRQREWRQHQQRSYKARRYHTR